MTGPGSPCGACKFLRRKCVSGCVFAPYFCHDQLYTHFPAIHKVFGASNVSKLLAHLPVSDRYEAALAISYEAQARLQDPIYGCVAHIIALQQQVCSPLMFLVYVTENPSLFSSHDLCLLVKLIYALFVLIFVGGQFTSTASLSQGTSNSEMF